MNQRYLGVILIVISVLSGVTTYVVYKQEQQTLNILLEEKGTCFLEDGTCVHEQANTSFFVLSLISLALFILALYLLIFDRAQRLIQDHHLEVSNALAKAKQHEREKDEFSSFLEAFDETEQTILKAIRQQEGITQSTLQYKTGLSKTRLSLILRALEEKNIVARKLTGKTKKIFLKKTFAKK